MAAAGASLDHWVFEKFLAAVGQRLSREIGEEPAEAVLADARSEYERLLPEVPDIGGWRNAFQPVMTVNGWIVALFRAMKRHGRSAAETVRLTQQVSDAWLRAIPTPVLKLIGRLALSGPARRYFARQAARSQQRRFAADFVWRVEEKPDGEFSMVFDECAVNKWYQFQDTPELAPYCNFFDVTYSRLMGMGIDATETIGQGCSKCALRFRHGRETRIPGNLDQIIPETTAGELQPTTRVDL